MNRIKGYFSEMSLFMQSLIVSILAVIITLKYITGFNFIAIINGTIELPEIYFYHIASALVMGILTFIALFMGKKASSEVGYNMKFDKSVISIKNILIQGFLIAVITMGISHYFFSFYYPQGIEMLVEGLTFTIYSGFYEEIWYRVGIMGMLSYSVYKLIYRGKETKKVNARRVGLVVTICLLVLIALNDIYIFIELTQIQIIISILVKILPAIYYTFLYYKKGFYYTILTHLTVETITNFIIIPLITFIQ